MGRLQDTLTHYFLQECLFGKKCRLPTWQSHVHGTGGTETDRPCRNEKKTKGRLSFAREKQPSCTGQMLLMIKPCLLTKRHGG